MWEAAGKILVELKAENPYVFEEIIAEHKDVCTEMLATLEDIGNQKLHPRTLLLPSRIAASVAAMPYDAQKYVVENHPIPVGREGHHKFKTIRQMGVNDASSAFSKDGIIPMSLRNSFPLKQEKDLGLYELRYENGDVFFRALKNKERGRPIGKPMKILLNGKPRSIHVYHSET